MLRLLLLLMVVLMPMLILILQQQLLLLSLLLKPFSRPHLPLVLLNAVPHRPQNRRRPPVPVSLHTYTTPITTSTRLLQQQQLLLLVKVTLLLPMRQPQAHPLRPFRHLHRVDVSCLGRIHCQVAQPAELQAF